MPGSSITSHVSSVIGENALSTAHSFLRPSRDVAALDCAAADIDARVRRSFIEAGMRADRAGKSVHRSPGQQLRTGLLEPVAEHRQPPDRSFRGVLPALPLHDGQRGHSRRRDRGIGRARASRRRIGHALLWGLSSTRRSDRRKTRWLARHKTRLGSGTSDRRKTKTGPRTTSARPVVASWGLSPR
jgi:hypothetical protein